MQVMADVSQNVHIWPTLLSGCAKYYSPAQGTLTACMEPPAELKGTCVYLLNKGGKYWKWSRNYYTVVRYFIQYPAFCFSIFSLAGRLSGWRQPQPQLVLISMLSSADGKSQVKKQSLTPARRLTQPGNVTGSHSVISAAPEQTSLLVWSPFYDGNQHTQAPDKGRTFCPGISYSAPP